MNKKIGIVTINFNTEDLLEKLIKCVMDQTYQDWTMVIVNNSNSSDVITEVINRYDSNRILLLDINENIGYSRGNNAGFRKIFGDGAIKEQDLLLFTNEDIIIKNRFLFEEAVKRMEQSGCGFWGPKIINTDGSMMLPHTKKSNYLKCLFHLGNNGVIDRLLGVNRNIKKIRDPLQVFLLNGAFFFCRVADFIKVGMLDENTFIYYEEELLYRNAAAKGIKVLYDPSLEVIHEHSASVKKSFSILRKKKFVFEGEIYFLKNILKINRFLELVFRLERNLEFFFYRLKS